MTKLHLLILVMLFNISSCTTSIDECSNKIESARVALMDLLEGAKGEGQQKKVAATAASANECLNKLEVPKEKMALAQELKTIWSAFKNTRETELVPAIIAGKREEATKIATGIQKERIDKIYALIKQIKAP